MRLSILKTSRGIAVIVSCSDEVSQAVKEAIAWVTRAARLRYPRLGHVAKTSGGEPRFSNWIGIRSMTTARVLSQTLRSERCYSERRLRMTRQRYLLAGMLLLAWVVIAAAGQNPGISSTALR